MTRTPPRMHNFCAGPGVLPERVLQEAREAIWYDPSAGTGILEISHRSPTYTDIAAQARARLRALLGAGPEWHILFLGGGASLQFHQVPLNFLRPHQRAGYVLSGLWAAGAYQEARKLGDAYVAASSEATGFDRAPADVDIQIQPHTAYLHVTSNNTIYGTRYVVEPEVDVPLVCDASSDFLSRPIALDKYGLIYAGAQKNLGPAGVTIVMVREDFLQSRKQGLPTLLDYGTHTASLFHTPPVFAVYLVERVLAWLQDSFGSLESVANHNERKAKQIYDVLDANSLWQPHAIPQDRSWMNLTFRLADPTLEAPFLAQATAAGLLELKGHRAAGGMRASLYNACPQESVDALETFLRGFSASHG